MAETILNMQLSLNKINLNDLSKQIKETQILKYVNLKNENPKLTKEQVCRSIGISTVTLNKYIDELNVDGFKRKQNKKKSDKIKPKKNIKIRSGENNLNDNLEINSKITSGENNLDVKVEIDSSSDSEAIKSCVTKALVGVKKV